MLDQGACDIDTRYLLEAEEAGCRVDLENRRPSGTHYIDAAMAEPEGFGRGCGERVFFGRRLVGLGQSSAGRI